MSEYSPYCVEGSYYEACNCDAICPCRRQSGLQGGRSTYGICQFLLSWQVRCGTAGALDLSRLAVVMAGFYDDDEEGSPWRIMLFVDENADEAQFGALSSIFLGRSGGDVAFSQALLMSTMRGEPASFWTIPRVPNRSEYAMLRPQWWCVMLLPTGPSAAAFPGMTAQGRSRCLH